MRFRGRSSCRELAVIRPAIIAAVAGMMLLVPAGVAQLTLNWTKSCSDDVSGFTPSKLIVDASGDIYLAGSATGAYGVVKYAPDGTLLWQRFTPVYGSCTYTLDAGLAIDSEGNVILRHRKDNADLTDCICALTKFDPSGNQLWSTTSAQPCFEIAVDGLDGIDLFGTEGMQFWTQKYSKDGVREWAASRTANYVSYTFGIAGHSDGSVYLLSNGPQSDNDDIVVIKYSALGAEQWIKRYNSGTRGDDWPGKIVLDSVGNAYVVGYSDADGENSHNYEHDIVTLKISSAGDLLWTARYSSGVLGYGGGDLWYDPWLAGIALDSEGNIVVAGRSPGGTATMYDFATIKYDASGNELWSRRYDSPAHCDDQGSDVAISPTGNIYSVGASEDQCPPDNTTSLYVAQFDASGTQLAQERQAGDEYNSSYMLKHAQIALSPQGSAYVVIGKDLRKYACVALTPPSASHSYLATNGTVGVASHSGCASSWTVGSNASWLIVTSGASGSGNGSVGYSLTTNATGARRVGTITVGDASFIVTQDSDPCTLTTPDNLSARRSGINVLLTWNAIPGTRYQIQRRYRSSFGFETLTTNATSPFVDENTFPVYAYLYRVRAVSDCMTTPYGNTDIATFINFTDDPIAAGSTVVRAAHFQELREAIADLREAAYLSAGTYTELPAAGAAIRSLHIAEMRANLNEALQALGLPLPAYSDPDLPAGTFIRKAHIQEMRDILK